MINLRERLTQEPVREGPPRRGLPGQRAEREQEQTARRHAVETSARIAAQGFTAQQVAEFLNLSARTLRHWRHDFGGLLLPNALGRPVLTATLAQRNDVFRTLEEVGPGIGLPTLRDWFPEVSRAVLDDMLRRYRCLWRRLNRQPIHLLHWTMPGRVWAIDFHGPRAGVDGLYPYLVAVRDLASGYVLMWRPVEALTADVALREVQSLFAQHGPPLVLKSDNGSAFIAAEFRAGLASAGVEMLFSPARTPSYNGSIEAGIGSLSQRTEQSAARRGHPGYWTLDDVSAAQLEANATARPFGALGPNPNTVWSARAPVGPEERSLFQRALASRRQEVIDAQGGLLATLREAAAQRATDRQAIRQVLVELGYLHLTRRTIPLPIRMQKAANIM